MFEANVSSFGGCAGDDAIEDFADPAAEEVGGHYFSHEALDFAGGVFAFSTMSSYRGQLIDSVTGVGGLPSLLK